MQYIAGEWKDGWVHKAVSAVRQPECSPGAQTAPGIVSFKRTSPNQICSRAWALLLTVARRKKQLTHHWNGTRTRRRWLEWEGDVCSVTLDVVFWLGPQCPISMISPPSLRFQLSAFPLLGTDSRSEWAWHLSLLQNSLPGASHPALALQGTRAKW